LRLLPAILRKYNRRNRFEIPIHFNARNVTDVLSRPRWLAQVFLRQLLTNGMPRFENYPPEIMDGLMARTLKKSILKNDSEEIDRVMALLGARSIADLDRRFFAY